VWARRLGWGGSRRESVEVEGEKKGMLSSTAVLKAREPRLVERSTTRGWTFLTHHAQVLLVVSQNPDLRVREIAEATGITERYAYRVLGDLQSGGYVDRIRHGRCNLYRINPDLPLGDPVVDPQSLSGLLRLIGHSNRSEQVPALARDGVRLDPSPSGADGHGAPSHHGGRSEA
jgi:hypothetical protein